MLVDLTLESSAVARVQQRFNQSGTGFYEGSGNVSVAMQRNASHLQFQVITLHVALCWQMVDTVGLIGHRVYYMHSGTSEQRTHWCTMI